MAAAKTRWNRFRVAVATLAISLIAGTILQADARRSVLDYLRYCGQFYRVAMAAVRTDPQQANLQHRTLFSYPPYRLAYVKAIWSNRGSLTPEETAQALRLVQGPAPVEWRLHGDPRAAALFFWQIGATGPAMASLKEHLDNRPRDVRSRYQLGLICQKIGETQRSNRLFERVVHDLQSIEDNPIPSSRPGSVTFGHAFYAVGKQRERSGNTEAAIQNYRMALRYDPWFIQAAEVLRSLNQTDVHLPSPRVAVEGDLGLDPISGVAIDDLDVELGGRFYMSFFRDGTGWSTDQHLVSNMIYDPAFEACWPGGVPSPFWPDELYNALPENFAVIRHPRLGAVLKLHPGGGDNAGFQSIPIPVDPPCRYLQIGSYAADDAVASLGHRWSSKGSWKKEEYVSYGSSAGQWVTRGKIFQPASDTTHIVIWNLLQGQGRAWFDNNILVRLDCRCTKAAEPTPSPP